MVVVASVGFAIGKFSRWKKIIAGDGGAWVSMVSMELIGFADAGGA